MNNQERKQAIADLEAITTPAEILVQIAHQSDPDDIVAAWTMSARLAGWDVMTAEIELHGPPVLDEPLPGVRFTPPRFPGLFDA